MLSPEELPPTKASIQYIKKHLDSLQQKQGSTFPALLSAINTIQTDANNIGEPYTFILLSNGHFLTSFRSQLSALKTLFTNPSHNTSFFTIAISDDNNACMLNLLATLGRGEYVPVPTEGAFARKLVTLIKRTQRPLAYDISISAKDPNKKITFYQNEQTAPLLFADKLYTIYGTTEHLEEIDIIIQGRANQIWFNAVKTLPFTTAQPSKK